MTKRPEEVSVGDGATYHSYTDMFAFTVISRSIDGRVVTIQADSVIAGKGHNFSTNQKWRLSKNSHNRIIKIIWDPETETYYPANKAKKGFVEIGIKKHYIDPNI